MALSIDRNVGGTTLHDRIYRALRAAILEGRMPTGSRLPATRVLAGDLGVSRTTVLTAYDRLTTEGYVASQAGGGTYVSIGISRRETASRSTGARANLPVPQARLSALGARMLAASAGLSPHGQPSVAPFALGVPALEAFPSGIWARLTARRWRKAPRELLAPNDGPGYAPLREAIADYVITARAVRCTPDQIVITAGSQQAIDLIARLLLDAGDAVWMEEYGYGPARAAFTSIGARVIGVPVDDEGLDVAAARRAAPAARLAVVTPACAHPVAATMSLRRRLALLDWAHQTHAWVIEDDYNGEFRYQGQPLASMQGLEHPGARRVIYLRTFSRTLFPALRLGYAVLPPELVEPFTRARVLADRHSPTVEQAVLADFIAEGHFARHVRHMGDLYAERQGAFLHLAARELGDLLRTGPAPAGIRLVGWLPPGVSDQRVAAEAAQRGVLVEALSRHRMGPADKQALLLGYVSFRPAETQRALAKLADAIRRARS
jgi:GntR family transcriptional regulator/MocR family aminotransferase